LNRPTVADSEKQKHFTPSHGRGAQCRLGPGRISRIAFVPGASHLSKDSISAPSGPNQNRRKARTQIHFRRGSDAEKWVDGTVGGEPAAACHTGASHLSKDSISVASGKNQYRRKAFIQIHFRRGSDAEKWVDGTAWRKARKSHRSVTVAARYLA